METQLLPLAGGRGLPRIPDIELLEKLGAGPSSVVYKAKQTSRDRLVVVKLLPLRSPLGEAQVARYRKELEPIAQLRHPNLAQVMTAGQTGEWLYIVSEYVQGLTAWRLLNWGHLPEVRIVDLILQAARGLEFAHARKLYHGNIKPGNLIEMESGTVKLLDFGIARIVAGLADYLSAHDVMAVLKIDSNQLKRLISERRISAVRAGHEIRFSKEDVLSFRKQMAGELPAGADLDARLDLYALGITMYQLATGEPPGARDPVETPTHRVPTLDPAFSATVLRILERDPAKSFPDASKLAKQLERLKDELARRAATAGESKRSAQRTPEFAGDISKTDTSAMARWERGGVEPEFPAKIGDELRRFAVPSSSDTRPMPPAAQTSKAKSDEATKEYPPKTPESSAVHFPPVLSSVEETRASGPRVGIVAAVALVLLLAAGGVALYLIQPWSEGPGPEAIRTATARDLWPRVAALIERRRSDAEAELILTQWSDALKRDIEGAEFRRKTLDAMSRVFDDSAAEEVRDLLRQRARWTDSKARVATWSAAIEFTVWVRARASDLSPQEEKTLSESAAILKRIATYRGEFRLEVNVSPHDSRLTQVSSPYESVVRDGTPSGSVAPDDLWMPTVLKGLEIADWSVQIGATQVRVDGSRVKSGGRVRVWGSLTQLPLKVSYD